MTVGTVVARIPLRGILWIVPVVSATVALALIVTTTLLERATHTVARDIAQAFIAAELENELLNHARLTDLLGAHATPELLRLRSAAESRLAELASEAERDAAGAEVAIVREARRHLDAVVAGARVADAPATGEAPQRSRRMQAALDRLHELQQLNQAGAASARANAARLDRIANAVGFAALLLLFGLVAAVVLARRYVSRPLAGIADAISGFRLGTPARRAPEEAPMELSRIARAFNETADALEAQRQGQLAFIGGVAHDLRNPLSALKTSAAVLARVCAERRDPVLDRTLTVVHRQVDRIERMVADLLDAARIEAGELRLKTQPVDVCAIARQSAEMFEDPSGTRDVRLACPETPVMVKADPGRLEQVVVNLLENAIKYSPPGTPVEVTVTSQGGDLLLEVTDHGAGIAPGELERIFEPFRRGRGSGAATAPGAGLGLSIVRRIVNAHGGTIEVESALYRGSTFRVRLPIDGPGSGATESPEAEGPASRTKEAGPRW